MIQTIKFKCETITPMFLAGADGKTPELRPPSIKGAMRFWWRALNANLVTEEGDRYNYSQLKRRESEIFGGTDNSGRSKVIILLSDVEQVKSEKISLTPHHIQEYVNGQKDFKASKRNGVFFAFELNLIFDNNVISNYDIETLVKTTFFLGGLGKRSRRGFGSVNLVNEKFNIASLNFDLADNLTPDYPYIKNIFLGKESSNYKDLLIDIGNATHSNKDNSLGYAFGKKRLSSPMFTSIIKNENNNYQIIITELNTVYSEGINGNSQKQEQFKKVLSK